MDNDDAGGRRPDDRAHRRTERMREPAKRLIKQVSDRSLVHPALIPGIGVERTGRVFNTSPPVFVISGLLIAAVIVWAFVAPDNIKSVGDESLQWVTTNFGWMYGVLALVIAAFMLVLGYSRTGGVRLGADDEEPEFTTVSWVAMLFSAGMGIGLLFYGPYEPLTYFMDPPHGFEVAPETVDAAQTALAQTMLHWGPIAWAFYALVGGAIAYSSYRRGRPPLISAIFEPIFGTRTHGPLGAVIDIFAIIVTLFGTAISLGIGAMQIARGTEVVTGAGHLGNTFIIGTMAVLTAAFIVSAVSGIKRGIRVLSNINMVIAGLLAVFVFIAGPTLFLLNLMPAGAASFFNELGTMIIRNGNEGGDTAEFMSAWTTYYWAWWVSWTPFVGMFIAKISRGRTLREFVTVVILVPAGVCFMWFAVFGGTSMWQKMNGESVDAGGSPEAMLFGMLDNLPFGAVTAVIAMVSIVVFFVTSADSASIVMGSMSQRGKPEPSTWVTICWGVLLGLTAASLLLAGGSDALGGLQSIMVVSSLPFAFVIMGMMVSWGKDLRTDPYMLRRKYARAAIAQGVRLGIANHGDDFVFGSSAVSSDSGAGAWLDSRDPDLVDWYIKAAEEVGVVDADDVRRTLDPGRIQPKGPDRPDLTASGDLALSTGRKLERLARKRDALERELLDNRMREQVVRRQESSRTRGRRDGTRTSGDDTRTSGDEGPRDGEQ
ncbi:BCCT family transporter [Tomitella cavernea]|uniref:BCCT family transporter n=1 Tax=Tomitella cavernea TaxID=1387982 RepID=A0ABP9C6F9_9ACTN|nr:BCCT family transporter [Tomitella cavernea]